MRRLGRLFGEDEATWSLTGLFHDLDQDQTADDPDRHAYLAAEWLREAGVDDDVVNGVLAHAHPEFQRDRMSKAVVAADAVARLLVAGALVRPERAAGMEVSSGGKKVKEKAFAPGANPAATAQGQSHPGLSLDQFIRPR